ncbi:MAG: TatD family hydrolase [Candidatus Omnitrophica bacterium]|nr:TatD family hydrolase [Candidatus Omnitrophota bacterium]
MDNRDWSLVDTHCHLDFPEFARDRDEVLASAQRQNVHWIISVGSSLSASRQCIELSKRYPNVFATVGCHPHDADTWRAEDEEEFLYLAQNPKVVAIGEIGLDYYRNLSSPNKQEELFRCLLRISKKLAKPVVIHCRQAQEKTLQILKEESVDSVLIHCFSGDEQFLKECITRGYLVSFTCNITYKRSEYLRQLVRVTPLECICLETDAPYLSPEGMRGKRNEPASVRRLAEEVALIKGVTLEEVARQTTLNAVTFFKLRI